MEIGIDINDKNQVKIIYIDSINGNIRIDITAEEHALIKEGLPLLYNGKLSLDIVEQQKIENENKILSLKQKLNETDYIVTKAMEYQLRGEPIPAEFNQVLSEREAWRTQINDIQTEIS